MAYGYNGKILRVDLTNRKMSTEEPDESFYRRYMGGRGFIGYYLLKELQPGIDPLGPDNRLIFVTGVITGGRIGDSAFGLDAAAGVMQFLEAEGYGSAFGPLRIPIVPAAVIFDLTIGDSTVRPDKEMGYLACLNAEGGHVQEGNVGAGTGATVGKILGMNRCMKAGVGTASIRVTARGNVIVGAVVVVNAMGDVVDPQTGDIIAGARDPKTGEFTNTVKRMLSAGPKSNQAPSNTTIGVIATNARLDKSGATKVAQMAHDGLARTIRPVHTMSDGDTIFALSTGDVSANLNVIGTAAAEVTAEAVIRAVRAAKDAADMPGLSGSYSSPKKELHV